MFRVKWWRFQLINQDANHVGFFSAQIHPIKKLDCKLTFDQSCRGWVCQPLVRCGWSPFGSCLWRTVLCPSSLHALFVPGPRHGCQEVFGGRTPLHRHRFGEWPGCTFKISKSAQCVYTKTQRPCFWKDVRSKIVNSKNICVTKMDHTKLICTFSEVRI